ncbi:MAG: substrate-binding domain-containing protein [Verrucomicrobiales bacterium]|jgi:phosphate transport system substrate-binding protein|nr:substrate-binding domain-containing protein [Verrucomicrobiales bacterium]
MMKMGTQTILTGMALTALLLGVARAEPVIIGGAALLPESMTTALSAGCETKESSVQLQFDRGPSDIFDLLKDRADIVLMSRYMTAGEMAVAKKAGLTLHPFTFAYEGRAMVVNRQNPLNHISREQARRIFAGDINDWQTLGAGADALYILAQVDEHIVKSHDETIDEPPPANAKISPMPENLHLASADAVLMAVSENNILGWIGTSWLKDARAVKILSVDGLLPTVAAVQGRSYPYIQGIYLYTRGLPEGKVREAVTYLTGPAGRKVLVEYGMVPGR